MTEELFGRCTTTNQIVREWVAEMVKLCHPDRVHWCNGSQGERNALIAEAVQRRILIKLNEEKLPGCYYHRSHVSDVARVEQATFICTKDQEEAGPTNNWVAPKEMHHRLRASCSGAMRGRTMYVVPYLMGAP